MTSLLAKIVSVLLIALGEFLAIYSEVIISHRVSQKLQTSIADYWYPLFVITLAGIPLILGYALGIKSFRSIWVVGAISISSIVFIEPIVSYAIFRELPSTGQLIGVALCSAGLVSFAIIP